MNTNSAKIYGLKSPDEDGIRYIGITIQTLRKRLIRHLHDTGKDKLGSHRNHRINWIQSLNKRGLVPEIVLIEDGLTYEEAKNKEINYIRLFKSFGAKLVNGTLGGEGALGRIMSEESRRKCSVGNKNKIRSAETRYKLRVANLGKKQSRLTVAKRVAKYSGDRHWLYNKSHSEEVKNKIGIKNGRGKTYNEKYGHIKASLIREKQSRSARRILSNSHKENISKGKSKPIIQLSKDFIEIKKWSSITEAQIQLKLHHISDVCRGIRKSDGGFVWKFENQKQQ